MKKEMFHKLLSKKLTGTITVAEDDELQKAIATDEVYHRTYCEMISYFNNAPTTEANMETLQGIWQTIERTSHTPSILKLEERKKPTSHLLKIAAILCLVIGVGLVFYQRYKNTSPGFLTVVTTGHKTNLLLDDGTRIWLNKESDLRYNQDFGVDKREVFLVGEAYFDVVKDKKVPLVIHVGDIDIKVKGTSFNVAARPAKKEVQIALVSGLIEVTNKKKNKTVLLRPFQKLVFAKGSSENEFAVVDVSAAAIFQEVKWKNDTLRFNKEKLKDLAPKLEQKFNVKISIASTTLREKRFSGTFVNESIQQVLEALKLSYPLTYSINHNVIVIKD